MLITGLIPAPTLAQAFSVVPVECIVGTRLGFFYELVAHLLLPILSFFVILLLALLVYSVELYQHRHHMQIEQRREAEERRADQEREAAKIDITVGGDVDSSKTHDASTTTPRDGSQTARNHARRNAHARAQFHHENNLCKMLNRPQVWTLNIWAWLLLYPTVTRKALSTFDCMELMGSFYLRSDAAVTCFEADHLMMMVLASIGTIVVCILLPLGIYAVTAANHNSSERIKRARVALLTNTYKDEFHYFEAVDLTRKLLLTSVVLLFWPDTIFQIWFVTAVGLATLVLYLGLWPYRDQAAGMAQLAALVQLEFTYVTAALFFDREPQDGQGIALVLGKFSVSNSEALPESAQPGPSMTLPRQLCGFGAVAHFCAA